MAFMFTTSTCIFVLALIVLISISGILCNGSDTLIPGQSLFSNQTLVSKGGKFELGFFSPSDSTNYYVGIWYKNIPVRTVVCVLNRFHPIPYSSYKNSQLQFFPNGSLYLHSDRVVVRVYSKESGVAEAVILDTGNLVLRHSSGSILWQSFDYPTDTWMPGMSLDEFRGLISWENLSNPSGGDYTLEPDSGQLSIKTRIFREQKIIWSSGPLQGGTFVPLSAYSSLRISYNFTYSPSEIPGENYFVYNVDNESPVSRIVLDYVGRLLHFGWSEAGQAWIVLSCNAYPTSSCRPNTICNANYSPEYCRCLDGFVPRVEHEWDLSDFINGCERTRNLECAADGADEGRKTRFMKVNTSRFPANPQSQRVPKEDVCNLACFGNCTCNAYYYANDDANCLLFMGDLSSLEVPSERSLQMHMYVNLKTESTVKAATASKVLLVALIVPITAALALLLISCFCFCYVWPKLKNKESRVTHQNILQFDLNSNGNRDAEEKNIWHEFPLPIFSFSSIAASTNNFSLANKLGEGGFGPVYKGTLLNEEFVAVKRLSRKSGQGLDEFKTETELISKLQHTNLVGILGFCTENDEMILVYEYMTNRSLDFFLFDQTKKELLDWKRRIHIISGIAQGLLYLHHDSRLRIVHRDLKASNILLDAEMNPKISDFGMARIFGGNDLPTNTKRIVGTYGYMSPEYAMEGHFSVKSDVFAFGVLMLEIISGTKNTGFYSSDHLSLLRYAWNLWKHDSAHELIDPVLEISYSSSPSILALRYIQISLLCVEENSNDRPLISDVIGMLNNENKAIASPKNPGFTVGRSLAKATPAQHKVHISSVNDLTLSNVEAR